MSERGKLMEKRNFVTSYRTPMEKIGSDDKDDIIDSAVGAMSMKNGLAKKASAEDAKRRAEDERTDREGL